MMAANLMLISSGKKPGREGLLLKENDCAKPSYFDVRR